MSAHLLAVIDRLAALLGHGITSRSATDEYGATPAVRFPELADYPPGALLRYERDVLLAQIRRERLARAASSREVVR